MDRSKRQVTRLALEENQLCDHNILSCFTFHTMFWGILSEQGQRQHLSKTETGSRNIRALFIFAWNEILMFCVSGAIWDSDGGGA